MKCEMHPEQDALGTCVSCGRGVCAICKVNYQGLMHCKQCLEAGRLGGAARQQQMMPMYYPYGYMPYGMPMGYYYNPAMAKAQPRPRGVPDGRLFKLGAVGAVGSGVLSIVTGALLLFGGVFSYYSSGPSPEFMAAAVLLAIFQILAAFGFLGFYKNYGPTAGLAAAGFLAPSGFIFVAAVMGAVNSTGDAALFIYLGALFLGIGHIISGITATLMRKFLDARDAPVISCIMFIIGGGLLCAFIGIYIIGWVFSAIGYFMLGVVMFTAPVPPPESFTDGQMAAEQPAQAADTAQPYPTDAPADQYRYDNYPRQ